MKKVNSRDVLINRGLRYSKPRETILAFFLERDMHVTAEDVYVSLKERGADVSLSTVYLNLGVLKDAGLIRELSGANGEAVFDSNVSPHYHLICKDCGEILDVPPMDVEGVSPSRFLQENTERETGWFVDEPSFELKGVCPNCQNI